MLDNIKQQQSLPKYSTYAEEALFGYKHIHKYLETLPPGSRILEVGAGPCLLINKLSSTYNQHEFMGVEPLGQGFHFFSEYHEFFDSQEENFSLQYTSYESIQSEKKWDLIYLVNVFEHLPDWRHFLLFVKDNLSKNGKCIILCPNYTFPYEPHFSVPILLNKKFTYALFRKKIDDFEIRNNCKGLWSSITFVTLWSVLFFSAKNKLVVKSDNSIVVDLVSRLEKDVNFANRHKSIAFLVRIFNKLGIINILEKKIFSIILPYMILEVRRGE